jgi:hypothetical protein
MQIDVSGATKKKHNVIQKFVALCGEQLMSKRLCNSLLIDVECIYNLRNKEGHCGTAMYEDTDFYPKEFSITIDTSLCDKDLFTTIAHEMVHIMQYATNKMRQLSRVEAYRYNGTRYALDTDYWERPWEIEAYEKEEELAKNALWNLLETDYG